jgi:hypothetical protein
LTRLGDLPFWLVLGVVAVAAAAGVFLAVQTGFGAFWYAGLVPAVILTVLYLLDSSYADSESAGEGDGEDFEDPVAEAARLEASGGITTPESTSVPASSPTEVGAVPPTTADGPGSG